MKGDETCVSHPIIILDCLCFIHNDIILVPVLLSSQFKVLCITELFDKDMCVWYHEFMEHRGRKPAINGVGEKVNKLAQNGFSYADIARMLRLKSRQLARYHFLKYRGVDKVFDKELGKE